MSGRSAKPSWAGPGEPPSAVEACVLDSALPMVALSASVLPSRQISSVALSPGAATPTCEDNNSRLLGTAASALSPTVSACLKSPFACASCDIW